MRHCLHTSLVIIFALFLASCGGSSGSDPSLTPAEPSGTGDTGATDGTGTGSDDVVVTRVVRFGSFSGDTFNGAVITSNRLTLEAGQSASLSVSFIDQNDSPVTDVTDVLFTSDCITLGVSEISPALVTNSNGTVNATYTARGCAGDDVVTAQTSLEGTSFSASVTLDTIPSPLGAISFVSASPQIIGIRGTGALPEQSVVTFLVTNASGGPVPNLDVDFSLNSTTNDIGLSNAQGTTNAEGQVTTTVISGTVATAVRVTATAVRDGVSVSSQSSALAITTGLLDQDSFSLAASILNIEGLSYDGITTELTIRAADRFNNPAPDGTAIAFTTEGASIDGNCITEGGACSVTLTSQNPRPSDGRVSILATAIGEESFEDTNPSNGSYDNGEVFTDLAEPFLDSNEDDIRDGNEYYVDFNDDTLFSDANGQYDGLRCIGDDNCTIEASTTAVRENLVIVLSGSSFFVDILPTGINLDLGTQLVSVSLSDINGQVPPAGTIVSVITTVGSISGGNSFEMLSTNNPGPAEFSFQIDPPTPIPEGREGTFFVTVTTPIGVISRASVSVTQSPGET